MQNNSPTSYNMEDLIQKLFDKIDNLERKLDEALNRNILPPPPKPHNSSQSIHVPTLPNYIPEIDFHQWIQNFDVGKEDVMNVLEQNILDGFKTCLYKHMCEVDIDNKPIFVNTGGVGGKVKNIYIFNLVNSITNEAEWRLINDNDIYLIIEIVWRKMVKYYFIDEEEQIEYSELSEDEKTQRDINKKVLLDMKKKLLNKHIKDITRFIGQKN